MVNKRATNYDEFEAGLLDRPEIRKKYEALKPKYEMIRSLIKRRNQLRISQTELVRIIGTKQTCHIQVRKRRLQYTLSTFFKVADALELDVSLKARRETKNNQDKVRA